jgi:hypothetical protein
MNRKPENCVRLQALSVKAERNAANKKGAVAEDCAR